MRRSMAALCLLVIFPFAASALGLGDIALDSALNQPFSAEIPLESYEEADLDALSVALASEATFKRYGLDRPAFMTGFEFSVERNVAGEPFVSITSRQSVSEPFVTLLLDIKWSSGRLLREYTVLLDPPLFEAQPVQTAVTAPPVVEAADSAPTANQGMAAGQVSRAAEPARAAVSEPTPAPRPVEAETPPPVVGSSAEVQPEQVPSAAALSGEYAVQRRDTLWGIAQRVKGDGELTTNQVMLALYRANPEAFLGNINRLKAGAILRVPPQTELSGMSPSEATAVVREQNAALSGPAVAASEPAKLTLVAPVEDDAATDTNETGAESDSAADSSKGSSALDSALDAAAQDVAADQMRGRIGELESDLAESRRLIDARDTELAALQRRIQVLEASGEQDAALVDEAAADTALDEAAITDEAVTDQSSGDALFADESAADPIADAVEEPVDPTMAVPAREESPSFISELLGNLWFWVSAAIVLLLALFVVRRGKQDGDEDSMAEQDSDYAKAIGALEDLPEAESSFVVEVTPEEEHAPVGDTSVIEDEAAEATASQGAQEMEALLDDVAEDEDEDEGDVDVEFSPAPEAVDIGATEELPAVEDGDAETPLEKTTSIGSPINLDKADPIAEADFHMAYGLYDQAAELLETSLESDPDNRDYRVKLVEVFFVWENRDGFLKHARILNESIGDTEAADWNKVVILGKQLCPDEEMFSGAETAAPAADSMDFEISDAGEAELDFTIGGNDAEVEAIVEDLTDYSGEPADDGALDFDLSDGAFEAETDDDLTVDLGGTAVATDAPGENDTVEAPTVESPTVSHDDSATLEAPSAVSDGETSEMTTLSPEAFDTEGVDLDLGDSEGMDDSAEVTVFAGAIDDDGDDEDIDATLLADSDVDTEDDEETLLAGGVDLEAEIEAELEAQAEEVGSDTVEQPQLDTEEVLSGDTAEQPALTGGGNVDFDLGMEADDDDEVATAIDDSSLPEDATMTEVGTKLDLARAYIDMGDPDGARSILNEVLNEGGDEQQQEARQLLEELGD